MWFCERYSYHFCDRNVMIHVKSNMKMSMKKNRRLGFTLNSNRPFSFMFSLSYIMYDVSYQSLSVKKTITRSEVWRLFSQKIWEVWYPSNPVSNFVGPFLAHIYNRNHLSYRARRVLQRSIKIKFSERCKQLIGTHLSWTPSTLDQTHLFQDVSR